MSGGEDDSLEYGRWLGKRILAVGAGGLFLGVVGGLVAVAMGGSRQSVAHHAAVVSWFLPVVLSLAVLLLPTAARGRWTRSLADFGLVALLGAALGTGVYIVVATLVPAIFGGYPAASLGAAERHGVGLGGFLRAVLIPTGVGLLMSWWFAVSPRSSEG